VINSEKAFFFLSVFITAYCFWTATCKPGTTWQQACNTCSCTGRGFPVCTLKACLPRLSRQVSVQQESCTLYMKKLSDKLNSSLPKDFSHLEHDAVWFGGYIASFYSNILPPTLA